MFSQIAIVLLGLFLIVMGFREGDYLNVGVGALVAVFAGPLQRMALELRAVSAILLFWHGTPPSALCGH